MRKDGEGTIEVMTDLPSPAEFRVDQLLTSSFFGLSSTTDPETEALFGRYYALLAMNQRDDGQEGELADLTKQLEGRRQFGGTERERLYYEAIDKILAQNKATPHLSEDEVRREAVDAVSAIWQQMTQGAAS